MDARGGEIVQGFCTWVFPAVIIFCVGMTIYLVLVLFLFLFLVLLLLLNRDSRWACGREGR